MLEKLFETDPSLQYPLSDAALAQTQVPGTPLLTEVYYPKGQIFSAVTTEKEKITALVEQFDRIAGDIDTAALKKELYTARTVEALGDWAPESYWLQEPLWHDYHQYLQQHPLQALSRLAAIKKQLLTAQAELQAQFGGIEKGEVGEELVAEYLRLFEGKYQVINNVLLNSRTSAHQETSEADFCVVTDKGVFVCEVKNKGNGRKTFIIEKDGRWLLRDDVSGRTEIQMPSPAAQNAIHCREIECYLEEKGYPDVPVIPVIIIANPFVSIDNQGSSYVVRKEAMYDVLRCDPNPSVLSKEQQKQIADLLRIEEATEREFTVKVLDASAVDMLQLAQRLIPMVRQEAQWSRHLKDAIYNALYDPNKHVGAWETPVDGAIKWNKTSTVLLTILGAVGVVASFLLPKESLLLPAFLLFGHVLPLLWCNVLPRFYCNKKVFPIGLVIAVILGCVFTMQTFESHRIDRFGFTGPTIAIAIGCVAVDIVGFVLRRKVAPK